MYDRQSKFEWRVTAFGDIRGAARAVSFEDWEGLLKDSGWRDRRD